MHIEFTINSFHITHPKTSIREKWFTCFASVVFDAAEMLLAPRLCRTFISLDPKCSPRIWQMKMYQLWSNNELGDINNTYDSDINNQIKITKTDSGLISIYLSVWFRRREPPAVERHAASSEKKNRCEERSRERGRVVADRERAAEASTIESEARRRRGESEKRLVVERGADWFRRG